MKPGSPTRSGNHWNDHEDALLDKAYNFFINKMALLHHRSVKAIRTRLEDYEHPIKIMENMTREISTQTDNN